VKDSGPVQSMAPALLARRVWRLLCSVRLALVLIMLIAAPSLVGALIIQAPGEVLRSPLSYDSWVEGLRPRFGQFTGLLDFLGLFRVFRVWWFNALVALLVLNLAVCTINRFPGRWRKVRRPMPKVGPGFFERGKHRAQLTSIPLSRREASDVAVKALRQQHYRVIIDIDDDSTHIRAERNRYPQLGTFLTHGGMILAIVAVIWGNLAGFSDNGLVIPDGSVRAVGHGTELSVLNEGFVEEDYPDGRPKDYRSDLVIYDKGREVKRQTIRVNQPLEYRGVRFHQAFFGNAAVMRVRDTTNSELLFEDGVALAYRYKTYYGEYRPVGLFTLPGRSLTVHAVSPAQDAPYTDSFIQPWEMLVVAYDMYTGDMLFHQNLAQGEPFEWSGLEFTFVREKQFTGLSVVRNPGVNFLWVATGFMVLGICSVLYFPHRRVWAHCSESSQELTLALAGAAPRLSRFDGEFQRLVSALEREMGVVTSGHEDNEERRP